jgi:hypothetical protein
VLRGALDHLASDFNDSTNTARLLILVSPTCPRCLDGVSIVAEALRQYPGSEVEVEVLVLWVPALAGDSPEAASRATPMFRGDGRVRHYWEEGDRWSIASAFRPILGLGFPDPSQIAWDLYLWYQPGVRWVAKIPVPTAWAHNLWDDPGVPASRTIDADLIKAWFDNSASAA